MPKENTLKEPDLAQLSEKFDLLIKKSDDLFYLQKLYLLRPAFVLEFIYQDIEIQMYLPDAERDFIQKHILRTNSFYETILLQKLENLNCIDSNSVVFDIGANIGNHSVFFSKVLNAKSIVSFEPQKRCYKILNRNIALNKVSNATTVNSLVGSQTGSGKISIYGAKNFGATSFEPSDSGHFNMISLDAYVDSADEGKIDFLKIDVEGMQIQLFEGAKGVLTDYRPIIWVELRTIKNEFEEAAAYLSNYGYKPQKLGFNDYLFFPE